MADKYRYIGRHADHLASGRPLAPGDAIAASHINLDDPHDKALVDDGRIINIPATRPAKKDGDAQ